MFAYRKLPEFSFVSADRLNIEYPHVCETKVIIQKISKNSTKIDFIVVLAKRILFYLSRLHFSKHRNITIF